MCNLSGYKTKLKGKNNQLLLRTGKQIEILFLFWDSSKTPIEKKRRETDQGGEVECIDLTVSDLNPWSQPGASGERERVLGL